MQNSKPNHVSAADPTPPFLVFPKNVLEDLAGSLQAAIFHYMNLKVPHTKKNSSTKSNINTKTGTAKGYKHNC